MKRRLRIRKPGQFTPRELHTRAILRSDKKMMNITAHAVRWLSNLLLFVWAFVFLLALKNNAGDGIALSLALAIPMLLLWFFARALPRLAAWLTKDHPE